MSNEPPRWQPPGAPPPPPGAPTGYPPPPPHPLAPPYPPGYGPIEHRWPPDYTTAQPPRPEAKVAGWLMIGGALVVAVGCFLPWLTFGSESVNGFDDLTGPRDEEAATGIVFMLFAAIMLGFGITTLAARRLLPIMIIGIVVAAFSLLGAIAQFSEYDESYIGDMGAGLPVVMLGSALSLAGAIAGCARRRRGPAPMSPM